MANFAYIDNQNLWMSARYSVRPWEIDMRRFRVYLRDKYDAQTAFLFMGVFEDERMNIYQKFQQFGYILMWKPQPPECISKKKGNVDTDVVFYMMKDCFEAQEANHLFLVSGDGDYFRLVSFLLEKNRFGRVLLPSQESASSLYRAVPESNKAFLDTKQMRKKIGRQ